MKKIATICGYIWAVLCLLIVLIMFPGLGFFSKQLASLPFMKINPIYSGGDVEQIKECKNYTLQIHKPVFEALIGESSEGFIQISWIWKDSLPGILNDSIDYNTDGKPDFIITVYTTNGDIQINPLNEKVKALIASAQTENGWIARIKLKK